MRKRNQKRGIVISLIIIIILICLISLLIIIIGTNNNVRNEIAHILSTPIKATGITGVNIGTNVIANFEQSTGAVTISSTSGVGTMEKEAFDSFVQQCGAANIRTITFTNQVYPPVDSSSLFEGLSNMTHVNNAENLNVNGLRSTYKMFMNCSSLVSVDVSTWNTHSIEDFSYMFSGCTSLTSLNVSGWNTGNAKKMDFLFSECNNVEVLDVSNWETGNVTTLLRTFSGCKKVTTLDVANWDIGKARNICAVFAKCESLTSIDVENWNTESAINMSYIFSECKNLKTVNVSKWKMGNATEIQRIFHGCTSLTEVDVSNWDTGKAYNMECIFYNCTSLKTIDVSRWNTQSATNMYALFWNCNKLTEIDVSNWNTGKVTNMMIMFTNCTNLRTLDVSRWDTGSATDLYGIFENCINLPVLDVSNWNTANVENLYHAFTNCNKLGELDVSKWNTSKVTNLAHTFSGCNEVTTLDVSKWDTRNVTNMNKTFGACKKLESLNLTSWNTAKVTNMEDLFYGCSLLKKMDLRSFDFSKVTKIDGFFSSCNGINEIWLPAYTSSEVLVLPDKYRDTDKPEKANIYHTEINNTVFAEPTHLFRGVFIFFDLGIAQNYVLTEYQPYTKAQYCIVEEATNIGGTEGKGKDILPITTTNYSDTINKASILWNETKFENNTGYKFVAWTSNYDNLMLGVPYSSSVFDKDITYTANFEALEVNYTVKHYQENLEASILGKSLKNLALPNSSKPEENKDTDISPNLDNYTLIETENLTGITDTQVTPETKNYKGFTTPNKKTVTISGDGSTIVEYFYTRNQYNVTLTKGEGIDSVIGDGKYYYEQDVSISAEVNEDYEWKNWTGSKTLVPIQSVFKMPAENVELRANSAKKTNIEIYYIDETNDKIIADKKIIEGYVGNEYEVKPIQINGYKYSSSSENTIGIMTEETIKIYFKYLKQTGLNVKYVDINTKEEIIEEKYYDCVSGEEYDVTGDYQDIDSYTFVKDSGNTKGIMINEGMDVIYYYAYNSNINIKYYDKYTNKEIDVPQIIEGYEGKDYTLKPKEIEGYKLIEIDNPEGTIERNGTNIKYYYAKEITLTLKYINKITKQELKEKKVFTYYSGDTYDLKEVETIGEYRYVGSNIGLKGKVASEDITIELYYQIDNTTSDKILPQAGDTIIIFSMLIAMLIISIIMFIKYRTLDM